MAKKLYTRPTVFWFRKYFVFYDNCPLGGVYCVQPVYSPCTVVCSPQDRG